MDTFDVQALMPSVMMQQANVSDDSLDDTIRTLRLEMTGLTPNSGELLLFVPRPPCGCVD